MSYIFILTAVIVLLLAYMRFEAGFVKIERVKFTKSKNCLKVIQLSDIHISRLKVSPNKIKRIIQNEKPDVILLTGDYIEKPSQIPAFLSFLGSIAIGRKTYLCLGNHDHRTFLDDKKGLNEFLNLVEGMGIEPLVNKSVIFEKNSRKYNLTGIDDLIWGKPDIDKVLMSCQKPGIINIAASHNPDIVFRIPRGKMDFLLCGHFHGGQIWTPFGLEFRLLRRERLCRVGISRGLHKVNGINIYINRGLGNVCVPLRFLSRPEITVFYFP